MDRARSSDQRELLIFFLILEVEPWQEVGTGAYKAEMDHLLRDRICPCHLFFSLLLLLIGELKSSVSCWWALNENITKWEIRYFLFFYNLVLRGHFNKRSELEVHCVHLIKTMLIFLWKFSMDCVFPMIMTWVGLHEFIIQPSACPFFFFLNCMKGQVFFPI